MNYPWGHNRRFNTYTDYFKRHFGGRVQKLSINAGFTCPNRDGTKATGGCTFCNNDAFNPSYCSPEKSITQQMQEGIAFHNKRYKDVEKFIAYFQAYSNTYSTLAVMRERFEEALSIPGVIGLAIGTRPDCIDDEKLDYIAELSKKYYVILEFGIESCYDNTLRKVNRGHTYEESVKAITAAAQRGIKTGGHIIFGFPYESREEMLAEADIISSLPLNTIKFHQLQILRGTTMAEEFAKNPEIFKLFSLREYIDFIVAFTERLNPSFVIERVAGESPLPVILTNVWNLRYFEILQLFEQQFAEQNTWQGRLYKQHHVSA